MIANLGAMGVRRLGDQDANRMAVASVVALFSDRYPGALTNWEMEDVGSESQNVILKVSVENLEEATGMNAFLTGLLQTAGLTSHEWIMGSHDTADVQRSMDRHLGMDGSAETRKRTARVRLFALVAIMAVGVLCVLLWIGEGPLWRATMLNGERVISPDGVVRLGYIHRWGERRGSPHGDEWEFDPSNGTVTHVQRTPRVLTIWRDGEIQYQLKRVGTIEEPATLGLERRDSPPWYSHPPLIDLTEFEE